MVDTLNYTTINIYPQLDNVMQFKLDEINNIIDYFMAEIHKKRSNE